jgi:restriction endonuclease Mrr
VTATTPEERVAAASLRRRTRKGVFVTTRTFTREAADYAA